MKIEHLIEQANGSFYYLASPYSHKVESVRDWRVANTLDMYGELIAQGLIVYHATHSTHFAAKTHMLPLDHEFWKKFNDAFIKPSAGIIVAGLEGWKKSTGVDFEIKEARRYDKPVYVCDPISLDIDELIRAY